MNLITQATQKLVDQEARDRFAREIEQNFSVIAPAGVGKTTAIVQRIVMIAMGCNYEILPTKLSKLVVVTYTQKAADEMKCRAYQALLQANCPVHYLKEFNKAFFGTIHSFCLKLIQSYGANIGIPYGLTLLTQDEDLWYEFLNLNGNFLNIVPEFIKRDLCQYINFDKLINLARKISLESLPSNELSNCPKVNLKEVLAYVSKRSPEKVSEIQNELKVWWEELEKNPIAVGIPEINQGDSEFKEWCANAFLPLWNWLGEAAHRLAWNIAKRYQDFRISKGMITYDDMIDLADKLIRDRATGEAIHLLDHHIILDEAQDTDTKQFAVLLSAVPLEEPGCPKSGRFSMLGDPQQAIYSSRADLPTYLKIHNNLLASSSAEMLTFNVTMRCDRSIVGHCNALFPNILKNNINTAQINFVPLNACPWAEEGSVGKIVLNLPENEKLKLNTHDLEKLEAKLLVNRMQQLGLGGLGVKDWSEVAILAPRKNWLLPIAKELQAIGIDVQIHSRTDIKGDNPAFAWMTALITIITSPNNSFETVGVLREIFGLSDDEIACYVQNKINDKELHPLNFTSGKNISIEDPVGRVLQILCELRNDIIETSLSEAIRQIIEKIDLKGRLCSLPEHNHQDLIKALDEILIQATIAEEQGSSITEFALRLRKDFDSPDDSLGVLKGHVQCFTSHKAKGLEWSVVIVPFLYRSILFPTQEYPQVINLGSACTQKIIVSSHPDKKQFEELLEQHRIAELERLLYVTATRARHRLLWVDDEELFTNSKVSFASLLKIKANGLSREIWNKLPDVHSTGVDQNLFGDVSQESSEDKQTDGVKSFDPAIMSKASERSKPILQRIIPSQLRNKIPIGDYSEKLSVDYSSMDYGNWWHAMMDFFPWKTRSDWEAYFSESLLRCPEINRGKREIELFYRSKALNNLLKESLIIQTEVPFIFKREGKESCEGVIDFFAHCEQTNQSMIIDWKTDLIDNQKHSAEFLRQTYEPQLAIYEEAVEKVYKFKPEIFLYSTFWGELINIRTI